jgi:hypothetical protein
MILSRFRFIDDLYLGTVLLGDFIKNTKTGKWMFMIDDIPYYKGKNIIENTFSSRSSIIDNILTNEFENDCEISVCNIIKKQYQNINKIKHIVDNNNIKNNENKIFNCKVSGLVFKNINNFSNNYLYIFQESRSDFKIKTKEIKELKKSKELCESNEINESKELCKSNEISESNKMSESKEIKGKTKKIKKIKGTKKEKKEKNILQKEYIIMEIRTTLKPDVYKLYHKTSDGKLELNSCAGIPSINVSNYIRKAFKKKAINDELSSESELSEDEDYSNIKMRCYYHKKFKKFVPYKSEYIQDIDEISTINQFIYV